jgi:hypothetical protein
MSDTTKFYLIAIPSAFIVGAFGAVISLFF